MRYKIELVVEDATKEQMDIIFNGLIDVISKSGVTAGGGFALENEEEESDEQEDAE